MKIGVLPIVYIEHKINRTNKKRMDAFTGYDDFPHLLDEPYIDDGLDGHKFDIFWANKENRNNICVIDIHGGAYILGHRRDNYLFARKFAEQGFDFIEIDYLSNHNGRSTKDSIDDCYTCIKYIIDNKEKYHLENSRFVLTGESAGGHFALVLAEAQDDEEYAKQLGYDLSFINFEVLLVNCPVFDYENIGRNLLGKRALKKLFGPQYNNSEMNRLISPKVHFSSLKTPLFLSTCKQDFIGEQSKMLKECMEHYKYPQKYVFIDSDKKKIDHVHNVLRPDFEESKDVNNAMFDFINEIMNK